MHRVHRPLHGSGRSPYLSARPGSREASVVAHITGRERNAVLTEAENMISFVVLQSGPFYPDDPPASVGGAVVVKGSGSGIVRKWAETKVKVELFELRLWSDWVWRRRWRQATWSTSIHPAIERGTSSSICSYVTANLPELTALCRRFAVQVAR